VAFGIGGGAAGRDLDEAHGDDALRFQDEGGCVEPVVPEIEHGRL
jgi:hypothetical protein